jgi:anaerobic selenocysteine-containing dehydrogenase
VRWLDALGAISGNLGVPGGGVSFGFPRRGAFDLSFFKGQSAAPRTISEPLLGPGILAANDPPIRMVWVHCGNPVAMLPESETVAEALRTRELTVVVDSFLTDTAANAHIVLPTTTMLEEDDLVGAYGHHWLGNTRRVVAPPEGVKSDYEIVQALAPRVGLGDAFSESVRKWKIRLLGRVAEHGITLEKLEAGAMRNPFASEILFEDRKFATSNGRVKLIHEPGPPPPAPTDERPLLLAALATRQAQSSQWAVPPADPPTLTVHPDAAQGFSAGQRARVESEFGSLVVEIRFDERQRRDMALMAKGGWMNRGACANTLIRARATDAGEGACYYDTPVRLLPE